jgi:hypothetical protein
MDAPGMTTIALALATLEGLVIVLLVVSQVELFRDIEQLRTATGNIDRPLPVDLGAAHGRAPGDVGLPAELDGELGALVLVLSTRCGTCRSIAETLGGTIPKQVWLLLIGSVPEDSKEFVEVYGFDGPRMVVDTDDRISSALGVMSTPTGIVVENGRLAWAQTVPSTRQLFTLIPQVGSPGPRLPA